MCDINTLRSMHFDNPIVLVIWQEFITQQLVFSLVFSSLQQIHALIMSLNYTGIEIKTANSLESWNGGVLIMASGSVLLKDFNGRRKFVQTFFLAPQESGFFVLSDIFHFIEEDQIHQHPVAYISPSIHDPKLHASNSIQESGIQLALVIY